MGLSAAHEVIALAGVGGTPHDGVDTPCNRARRMLEKFGKPPRP